MDIFWGSSQNWTIFRGISMHFMVFFKVNVQIGVFLGGRYNFKYCFGVLEIPDNFL